MARLAGCSIADVQKDRLGVARNFAREHEVIVVLKGHRTLVVQPDGEAWVNTTGNPGMSTGGTGDILTGMVAAMIAQNPNDALLAVLAAVHLHGLAGDVMRESVGEHSLVATDLLRGLPEAFWRAQKTAQEKFVRLGRLSAQPQRGSEHVGVPPAAYGRAEVAGYASTMTASLGHPDDGKRIVFPGPPNAALRRGFPSPSHLFRATRARPLSLRRELRLADTTGNCRRARARAWLRSARRCSVRRGARGCHRASP